MSIAALAIAEKFATGTTGKTDAETHVSHTEINQVVSKINELVVAYNGLPTATPLLGEALVFATADSNWVKTGEQYTNSDTGNGGWSAHAVATKKIAAGQDGKVWQKIVGSDTPAGVLGFRLDGNLGSSFFTPAGYYLEDSNLLRAIYLNDATVPSGGIAAPSGAQYIGIERIGSGTSSININLISSPDGVTFTSFFTFDKTKQEFNSNLLTAQLFVSAAILAQGNDPNTGIMNPRGLGLS